MTKDGGHGGGERRAELKFVDADEAPMGVHGAVVMHHCGHEAACKGMAVHEGDGWHWVPLYVSALSSSETRRGDTHVSSRFHSGYRVSLKNPFFLIAVS